MRRFLPTRSLIRFAQDSALEGTGFEPSVPGRGRVSPFPGRGTVTEATRGGLETVAHLCREHFPLRRGLPSGRRRVLLV
jgi:hypothetical protein